MHSRAWSSINTSHKYIPATTPLTHAILHHARGEKIVNNKTFPIQFHYKTTRKQITPHTKKNPPLHTAEKIQQQQQCKIMIDHGLRLLHLYQYVAQGTPTELYNFSAALYKFIYVFALFSQ